jgi:hypothetical protein
MNRFTQFAKDHQFDSAFGSYRLSGAMLSHGLKKWQVPGAVANIEVGGNVHQRVTATRLALIGPFALAVKKGKGNVYVVVALAGGEQLLIEAKVKQEKQAREFVTKVNNAGVYWAQQSRAES